jgi:PAS domain S-box-containing protein
VDDVVEGGLVQLDAHRDRFAGMEIGRSTFARPDADRLAALTARAAGTPIAMIHVESASVLQLLGAYGVWPSPDQVRCKPTQSTIGGLVVRGGAAVAIADVLTDPRVPPDAPALAAGLRSYAGYPIRDLDDEIVGVCAVLDYRPRDWQPAELAAVDDAAQACTAFVLERNAREAAEHQNSFLDALLNSLDTGVAACDARGELVLLNRSLRTRLGTSLRTRLGTEPGEQIDQWPLRMPVMHPDGRPFQAAEMPLAHALHGRQVRGVEQLIEAPDGSRRWYLVNAHPIIKSGVRLGAVSAFHDVTERRRAERFRGCQLAVSTVLNQSDNVEQAMPRVLEAVAGTLGWPYAELWLVDPETQALRQAAEHRSAQQGLLDQQGLSLRQRLAEDAWRRNEPVWLQAGPGPGLRTSLAVPISSGGRTLAVMTLFAGVVEDPQESLIALLASIAAHVGQFLERRRAEVLQLALSRSKDEYLNLVGHELRSPLTVISANLELVGDTDPDAAVREIVPLLAAVQRSTDRLRRLVEALLDVSALESGHAEMRIVEFDFAAVVAAVVGDVRPDAGRRGIEVATELPEELPLFGDPGRLRQVVAVLVDNALTYTLSGGQVTIALESVDGLATLEVADTGVGIPDGERPYLFQRFFRGAVTQERGIPGVGLGLATAHLIMQRHSGQITVDCGPDRVGTIFRVRMPVHPPAVPPTT